jgi:hypothetical protein
VVNRSLSGGVQGSSGAIAAATTGPDEEKIMTKRFHIRARALRWLSLVAIAAAALGALPADPAGAHPSGAVGTQAAAAPSAVASGVTVRTKSSAVDSESLKTAFAPCPAGKVALGGGARITPRYGGATHGQVILVHAQPLANGYYAGASEWAGGYSYDWFLVAYAVCGDQPAGYQIVQQVSDTETEGPFGNLNDTHASCPSGKKVIGTGGALQGARGQVSFQQIRPNQQGAYVFVQGILHPGFASPFTVYAWAVCANPLDGWHVVIDGTDYSTDTTQQTSVACPAGEQALGAGFTKGDDFGAAHIESFSVRTFSTSSTVYLNGGAPFTPQPWNIAAWAVCVDRP